MEERPARTTRVATGTRRRIVVDDSALASRIGERIRQTRLAAGLTQTQVADGRYTKGYISALENGQSKPSMAALNFIAERLGVPVGRFLDPEPDRLRQLDVDVALASGRYQEAVDGYRALLDADHDARARARMLCGLAEALVCLDRPQEAVAAASESVQLFGAAGASADGAIARYWLAGAQFLVGNGAEAEGILRDLLATVRGGLRVEPDFEARILMSLASAAARDGRHPVALAYLEEIRSIAAALDDHRRAAYLYDLSYNYRETGDIEAALRTGTAGLALYRAAGFELGVGALENDLALSYLAVGNTERARSMAASSAAHFESMGDHRWLAHVTETQAQVERSAGELPAARALAERSLILAEETHNDKAAISALRTLARIAGASGSPADALPYAEQAAERARATGSPGLIRDANRDLAELLAETGDHARAFALMREALDAG
ncbi:MAG: transcriptional regulator [Chloroflexota bacterium]